MKFALKKNRVFFFFFCKLAGYKSEKGIIEDLNFFKKIKKKERKNDRKNSKNISRTFSGFVVSIVCSVHFGLVLWSDIFLKIYRPLPM